MKVSDKLMTRRVAELESQLAAVEVKILITTRAYVEGNANPAFKDSIRGMFEIIDDINQRLERIN